MEYLLMIVETRGQRESRSEKEGRAFQELSMVKVRHARFSRVLSLSGQFFNPLRDCTTKIVKDRGLDLRQLRSSIL